MFIEKKKKKDHIWKRGALWFQVEELINPSKFSQILSAKKRGNYRHDRCFASNTSEDMLQPINKYKKKIIKKKKNTHTHTQIHTDTH